jgi:sigma-B regulation protein RsbU (phosphoserine phosphatase)
MKIKLNKYGAFFTIFLLSAVFFVILTVPFKLWLAASELTEMRPTTALTPILGMIFGWPAAFGCALGNLVGDLMSGYEISYSLLSMMQQLLYAMVPYFLWKKLNREQDDRRFRLDSISRILKFCFVLLVDALLVVICTGLLNQVYSVANFISMENLYLLINSFDSGLLFGAPFLILGHLLQRHIDNLENEKKEKVFVFSLNERMILNTIITGIAICFLIGAAVYLTDRMNAEGSTVGLWGRIYLFESLALNFYFLLSMGFMWFTEKHIARPVEHLAKIAANYYVEHSTDEQRERMITSCEQYADDFTEVGNLARSYISMVKDLESYVANLQNITAEKERINAELTLASHIQAHMLPCIFPPFPEHDEFDIYATMTPAKEVGGDFYDFFMVDETHLAVVISDVSGKGVPAALFMVISKTLIKNYAQMGMMPCEIFSTVNRLLCDGNDAGLFVASWLGILDLTTGKLTYANAGHNPPLLKSGNNEFTYLKTPPSFVLAGMEDIKYRQNEITLQPGDRLFLYTDGVTEATDAGKQLYGENRLLQFMNRYAQNTAADILHKLKEELDRFVGEAPQFDDITMLMLDYRNRNGGTKMDQRVFPAKEEALSEVIGFIEAELERVSCPQNILMAISVAIEEVFVNIVHYAYGEDRGDVKVGFEFEDSSRTAVFCISDKGIPFNPLQKPDPDITLSAEKREIGGLGIFIAKKTMDHVSYRYENGENILSMTKKI